MGKEKFISVTHFINPQLFWYHKIDVPNEEYHEIIQLEQKLQDIFKNKPVMRNFHPKIGDIVAVSFLSWNKYIRVRIEQTAHFRSEGVAYIVWAIDYGFPFQTKLEHIRRMPEGCDKHIDHIRCGGLANLCPAENEFDFMIGKAKMTIQDAWHQRACDSLEKLITDAASVTFVEEFQITNAQSWGDLKIVNHKGHTFLASDYLVGINFAIVDKDNFRELCRSLKASKMPCWLSNDGNSKYKQNTLHCTILDRRLHEAGGDRCDDFSKKKVEDWCARNERAGISSGRASAITMNSADCPIERAALTIDDIAFEDSVSIKQEPLSNRVKDTTNVDPEEEMGFMRLAGAITKTKRAKNAYGKSVPTPPASAFEIPSVTGSKVETEDYPNSSISGESILSARKKKLLEMRKKLAAKQLMEQNNSLNQTRTSVDSESENIPYQELNESSFDETHNSSSACKETDQKNLKGTKGSSKQASNQAHTVEVVQGKNGDNETTVSNKMHNMTLESEVGSESSITSIRAKKLLEIRRKRCEASAKTHESQENISLIPSSLQRNPKIVQGYENNTDKDEVTSNTSSEAAVSYIERLKNTRKRIQERKVDQTQNDMKQKQDIVFTGQDHANLNEDSSKNVGQTDNRYSDDFQSDDVAVSGASKQAVSKKNFKTNDPFEGITMVPAGFDLTRLVQYRDEENHWHRKKSTRNDIVPHDPGVLEEILLNISQTTNNSTKSDTFDTSCESRDQDSYKSAKNYASNQNFRHTRSHTDKYKEINALLQTENTECTQTLLDSSLPDIGEVALKPVKSDENKTETVVKSAGNNSLDTSLDTSLEMDKNDNSCNLPAISESDSFKSTTSKDSLQQTMCQPRSLVRTHKRRQLKSPAEQGPKMEQILRRAKFEKELGNTEILDLSTLNVGGLGKSESDTNSTCDTVSENDTKTALEDKYSSNSKSTTVSEHKTQIDDADKLKLDLLVEQLNFELNIKNEAPKAKPKKKSKTEIVMPYAQQLREIDGEIKIQTKFIEHLVLAHSNVPLHPLEQLADAFFLPEIYNEMVNMRVTKVYRIQAYSWSHLLRGNSLFVVNPTKSGKTWCYMPPLCNLVSYRMQNETIPETFGPVAIVMVHSASNVEHVNNFCRRLVINSKAKVTVVPSYGMRTANEVKIQLLNSCGILVVTPANLARLLHDNEEESLIDPERLQHLVVDDLDLILSRSRQDFELVLRTLYKMVKKPKEQTIPLQVVVTSREWNSHLMSMICWSNQPLLLIGDFLEAAVYGRAEISLKLRSRENKLTSVMRYLEKHPAELERVLILCNNDNDLDDVVQALTESGQACIGYGDRSDSDVRITIDEWKKKKSCSQVIVCTDSVLPELMLQNVETLIHFSMPSSWTKFTSRFSTLSQSYENSVANGFAVSSQVDGTSLARSLILMDEDNNLQLPRLIDFMEKHGQLKKVHPDILAVAKRLLIEREEARILNGTLLCPYFLEFGDCDEVRCDYRHNLTRFDAITKNDDIPASGDTRLQILKVFSPTHYTARLLEHKSAVTSKWVKIRRSDEAALFGMQLNMHYMNTENWITYWPIKVNDLCIYKTSDTYQRARILDVPFVKHTDIVQSVRVTVKLIDMGTVISSCRSDELLVLDDKFKDFPAQAVDVRLLGVVPFDNERTWDSKGTKAVQKWIITELNKKECVFVDISFALANTIWVKNVIVMERLPTVGQYIYRVNLKRSLIEKNFGCLLSESNNKSKSIRDIAEEFGLFEMQRNQEDEKSNETFGEEDDKQLNDSNLMKFSSNEEEIFSLDEADIEQTNGQKGIKENKQKFDATQSDENWDDSIESNKANFIDIPLSNNKVFDNEGIQQSLPKNNSKAPTKSGSVNEQWCRLPLHSLAKVEIGDEKENGHWTDINMQHIDDWQMEKFQELTEIIIDHVEDLQKQAKAKQLNIEKRLELRPGQNCIVKYDNIYCRAKLHGIFGNENGREAYRFFLCDYACFVIVNTDELFFDFLYETTREIVEYTPYQAVHCRLVGIKLNEFANRHPVVKDYLYAYAVSERSEASTDLMNLGIQSFEILLYECDKEKGFGSAVMLNKILLEQKAATLDVETKHFLELMPTVDLTSYNIDNATQLKSDLEKKNMTGEVASFEELLQIICNANELDAEEALENEDDEQNKVNIHKSLVETKAMCYAAIENHRIKNAEESKATVNVKVKNVNSTKAKENFAKSDKSHKFNTSLTEESNDSITSYSNGDNSNTLSSSSSLLSPGETLIPLLKSLYKRPKTEWYESDFLIYLAIYAPDITDYYLKVTKDTVHFAAVVNGEQQVLVLNLLGTVEPQQVSHEIRGLNVVVRLVKTVFMKWPRLLQQATKFPWLSYNYNSIDLREIEEIQPQQRMNLLCEGRNKSAKDLSSDDDISDEEDLYQTFTPIVNSEDFHDPTADIY